MRSNEPRSERPSEGASDRRVARPNAILTAGPPVCALVGRRPSKARSVGTRSVGTCSVGTRSVGTCSLRRLVVCAVVPGSFMVGMVTLGGLALGALASGALAPARTGAQPGESTPGTDRVLARSGALRVTEAELLARLAQLPPAEDPEAQKLEVVRALMREARLAAWAEERGFGEHPWVRAAERDALNELLEESLEVTPAPMENRTWPERRALVRFAATRAEASAVAAELRGAEDLEALVLARVDTPPGAPHSAGDLDFFAEQPRAVETALAPELRRALWRLSAPGDVSGPVELAGGLFGVVVLTGTRLGVEPVAPAPVTPEPNAEPPRDLANGGQDSAGQGSRAQLLERLRRERAEVFPERLAALPSDARPVSLPVVARVGVARLGWRPLGRHAESAPLREEALPVTSEPLSIRGSSTEEPSDPVEAPR